MQVLKSKNQPKDIGEKDGRPRFGIGHVSMTAANVEALANFYTTIGMREIMSRKRMAIVELRGGTHIVIQQGAGGVSNLDLIVDDIDDTHRVLQAANGEPSAIRRGNPHDSFRATDPEGNQLVIHSNHAMGVV